MRTHGPRAGPWPPATPEAPSNDESLADEPDDHALYRSRGGLSTKIHAVADAVCDPVAVRLTAGQAGDNPQLLPLLDGYFPSEFTDAGPLDVRLLADKAYSHPSTRRELRRRRVEHTIPERRDQIAAGRPKARRVVDSGPGCAGSSVPARRRTGRQGRGCRAADPDRRPGYPARAGWPVSGRGLINEYRGVFFG